VSFFASIHFLGAALVPIHCDLALSIVKVSVFNESGAGLNWLFWVVMASNLHWFSTVAYCSWKQLKLLNTIFWLN